MANNFNYSADYEKLFFLYSLKNPKYFKTFFSGFFNNDEIDVLANMSKKFHEEFQESPSKHQLKLLIEKSKYNEKIPKDLIDAIFETDLNEYDEEWLKRIAESWIKWRNFDKQLIKTIQYIKLQDIEPDKVDGVINNAISMISERGHVNFSSDTGINFFDPGSHEQHMEHKISSGINFIDRLTGGGYDPKTLVVYAGEQNIGKCPGKNEYIEIKNKKTNRTQKIKIGHFFELVKRNKNGF